MAYLQDECLNSGRRTAGIESLEKKENVYKLDRTNQNTKIHHFDFRNKIYSYPYTSANHNMKIVLVKNKQIRKRAAIVESSRFVKANNNIGIKRNMIGALCGQTI